MEEWRSQYTHVAAPLHAVAHAVELEPVALFLVLDAEAHVKATLEATRLLVDGDLGAARAPSTS